MAPIARIICHHHRGDSRTAKSIQGNQATRLGGGGRWRRLHGRRCFHNGEDRKMGGGIKPFPALRGALRQLYDFNGTEYQCAFSQFSPVPTSTSTGTERGKAVFIFSAIMGRISSNSERWTSKTSSSWTCRSIRERSRRCSISR